MNIHFISNRMRMTSMGKLVAKLIVLSLGLLFLLPSAYKLFTYGVFRYHAISVDGVIIDASRGRGLGGRPFVEYEDLQGKSYVRKSKAKTHWLFAPEVGEKVRVFYDERKPDMAIVDSTFYYIVVPLLFIATGGCFLLYGFKDSQRESGQSG